MSSKSANLIAATIMLLVGAWGAWISTSWTARIPIGFGLILLGLHFIIQEQKKWSLILVLISSLGFGLSLIMPAIRMYDELNYIGVFRIVVMIVACLWAGTVHFKTLKT